MTAAEQTEYLESKGWERRGVNEAGVSIWADPAGAGPKAVERRIMATLPGKGGGPETPVYQGVLQPVPWDYTLERAVMLQKERDAFEEAVSPLERLEELGRRYDSVSVRLERLIAAVEATCSKPTPEKKEGWESMKRKLAEAARVARVD